MTNNAEKTILNLEDLIPIKNQKRNSYDKSTVSLTVQGLYFNNNFVEKYLIKPEGYSVIFLHPKLTNTLIVGFYADSSDLLSQHKSIAKRYKAAKTRIIIYNKEIIKLFGKQSNIFTETVEIANKIFFLLTMKNKE